MSQLLLASKIAELDYVSQLPLALKIADLDYVSQLPLASANGLKDRK